MMPFGHHPRWVLKKKKNPRGRSSPHVERKSIEVLRYLDRKLSDQTNTIIYQMGLNPRQRRARAKESKQQQEIESYRKRGYFTGNETARLTESSTEVSSIESTTPKKKRPCPVLDTRSPVTSRAPPAPPEGCLPYSFMVRRTNHKLFPKTVRRLNFPPEKLAYPGDIEGHPDILRDHKERDFIINKYFMESQTPSTSPRI